MKWDADASFSNQSRNLQLKNHLNNFREVEDKVELVALLAAIYDAYQKVLPKRKEKLFEEEKEQVVMRLMMRLLPVAFQ